MKRLLQDTKIAADYKEKWQINQRGDDDQDNFIPPISSEANKR